MNLKTRRISLSVDLPDALVGRLRRWRRGLLYRRYGGRASGLLVAPKVPDLTVRHRDVGKAISSIAQLARPPSQSEGPGPGDLADVVAHTYWYHTIELPGGIVTSGYFDHRPLVPRYGLPNRLDGQRALDVATFDGFWAFEFERRGADVVAVDVPRLSDCDLPPPVRAAVLREGLDMETGGGFRVAQAALGSKVRREEHSVYDLDPSDLGTFDLVHIADLLVHLERPLEALRAVRRMTAGRALVADCFDPSLEPGQVRYEGGWHGFTWSVPSLGALAQMVLDAGFADVEVKAVYSLPYRDAPLGPWRASLMATT